MQQKYGSIYIPRVAQSSSEEYASRTVA